MAGTRNADADRYRLTVRFDEDTWQRLHYWASRNGMGVQEYIMHCIDMQIARSFGDYTDPEPVVQRLNELIDATGRLADNQERVERIVVDGLDALIGITRGPSAALKGTDG